MSEQHGDFRDRLKAAQHFTPEYRERFERSMKAMAVKELTPAQRVGTLLITLFTLAGLAVIAWLIVTRRLSTGVSIAFGLLGAVVLVITVYRARDVVTGRSEMRTQPKVIAQVGWFGALLYMIAMMIALPTAGEWIRPYFTMLTLFPLIVMAAALLQMNIGESHLATSEKLLELELKLAEISEKLDKLEK